MNKLTVVFIVITIIVVVVLGTLLGIRFFTEEQTEQTPTTQEEVPEDETTEEETTEEESQEEEEVAADFPAIVSPFEAAEDDDKEEEPVTEPEIEVSSNIDITKIIEAGYDIPDLLKENFEGTVFGTINISEYNDDNHSKFIVTEAEEYAGTVNELIFPDSDISSEVYASVKTKIQDQDAFELNETNQYGDASFFANNSEEKNSVFLVVKKAERLYTLHYPAKNHNKMKNLINLL